MPVTQTSVNDSYTKQNDVKLVSVTLSNFTQSASIDITLNTVSIVYYEDIFAQTMHGSITINDNIGLLTGKFTNFPIIGEEWLTIEYYVPMKSRINLKFHVYKVPVISSDSKQASQKLTLHFVSEEVMMNCATRIQKSYSTTISSMVSDIYNGYLTINSKKPVSVSYTNGLQNIIVPNLRPFEAIKFLEKRATSSLYPTNSFLHFENVNGFYFTSIEEMFASGEYLNKNNNNPNYVYTRDVIQTDGKMPLDLLKNINKIEVKHGMDTIAKMNSGYIANKAMTLSPVTYEVMQNYGGISQTSLNTASPGAYSSDAFINTFGNDTSSINFNFIDKTQPYSYKDTIAPNKKAYFAALLQNVLSITVAGDTDMRAGDTIYVKTKEINGSKDGTTNDDPLRSGIYLIGCIRHELSIASYSMTMDIYKDGFHSAIGY